MSDKNKAIISMYQGGESMNSVAKAFGISRQRVHQILVHFGIERRGQRDSASQLKAVSKKSKKIAKMYRSGMSTKQISESSGLSFGGVQYHLIRAGVKRRVCGSKPIMHKEQRDRVRLEYERGEITIARLAERYGVTDSTISRIIHDGYVRRDEEMGAEG